MKTLSRKLTATFFEYEGAREALRKHWADKARFGAGAEHIALYTILMGRDWTKGFVPVGQEPQPKPGQDKAYYRQLKDREGTLLPRKEHTVNRKGTIKLANGVVANGARERVARLISSAYYTVSILRPFGGLVSPDVLERVRLTLTILQPFEDLVTPKVLARVRLLVRLDGEAYNAPALAQISVQHVEEVEQIVVHG